MVKVLGGYEVPSEVRFPPRLRRGNRPHRGKSLRARAAFLMTAVFAATLLFGQTKLPRVTAVDPTSGKVNDNVTLTGQNLGKDAVSAAYLSDDTDDYKAVIAEQADGRIVMKVPSVKPGDYHVSLEVGSNVYIQPVRFTVQE